ncbi:PREDICTED: protein MNN4-like [Camelina sativa]|uniref:Protein MNN4-like n=1 Tax=Camelina sativa TaxID=90675 RepID=A0ABM0U9Z7_CAMSA|nr:PREDICTED: protein MNN4-like [Camelina sativa]
MPSYADSERLIGDAAKIPDNTVFDARKQEEDEEAKQLLVDMIVNETMKNPTFMESLRKTKVDTAWDEKRKQEKEELKEKRDEEKKRGAAEEKTRQGHG